MSVRSARSKREGLRLSFPLDLNCATPSDHCTYQTPSCQSSALLTIGECVWEFAINTDSSGRVYENIFLEFLHARSHTIMCLRAGKKVREAVSSLGINAFTMASRFGIWFLITIP